MGGFRASEMTHRAVTTLCSPETNRRKQMNKDEAWQDFCEKTMPQKDKSYVYALDGTMYAVWCAAWDAANIKEKSGG